jgi:natural product precursor
MKKRIEKKLSLSRETLRDLSEREMTEVVGGITGNCGGTSSSCTYESCPCVTRASNCC